MSTVTSERELVAHRVVAAPRELVFRAWTEPEHLRSWWGPEGFTNTFEQCEPRPGGAWRFVMHGPDGTNYKNESRFVEVVEPELVVIDHLSAPRFRVEIDLAEAEEGTAVTFRQIFETAEICARVKVSAGDANEQNLDRLEAELTRMSGVAGDFVITRIFDAQREQVFQAWTDPQLMARWWGPHAFTNPACELDLRPGGAYRIVMRGPKGGDYPVSGLYRDIVEPERLEMTVDCSGHPREWHELVRANGGLSGENAAGAVDQLVTFENLDGRTRLAIRMRFESLAIRDAMVKIGMNEGWSQSLERLAALLVSPA
jgi:uncharacterized protein YndB with AHSA1/START domain